MKDEWNASARAFATPQSSQRFRHICKHLSVNRKADESHKLIAFEAFSRGQRIIQGPFLVNGFSAVVIPASVKVLGAPCFYCCTAYVWIQLERIENNAFRCTSLQSVVPPNTVNCLGGPRFAMIASLRSFVSESGWI